MIEHNNTERYLRQMQLKGFGLEAQQKLLQARVLIVGAGGLGCPVIQYLAAAGVGTLGIVDNDIVEVHNLHRQVIYQPGQAGQPKTACAATFVSCFHPDIKVETYNCRMTNHNAIDIMHSYNVVVDATDNVSSRYIINDAAYLLKKPLVYAAISQYEGQVAVFNAIVETGRTANYRDIFPNQPKPGTIRNCADAGVLGVLVAVVGGMQASEVIKLVTGIGTPLINTLLTYNLLHNQVYSVSVDPVNETPAYMPTNIEAFTQWKYSEEECDTTTAIKEISAADFDVVLSTEIAEIVDVRNAGELPVVSEFKHVGLPLNIIEKNGYSFNKKKIVVFCNTGTRSATAAIHLQKYLPTDYQIYNLQNGIIHWKNRNKSTNTHE